MKKYLIINGTNSQNSTSASPSYFGEHIASSKKNKKRFLPIISIALSTLLLSFSGDLLADDTPDINITTENANTSIKVANNNNNTTNITLKGGVTWKGKLRVEAGIGNVMMDNATWDAKTSDNSVIAFNNGNDFEEGIWYIIHPSSTMKITANNQSKIIGDISNPTESILNNATNTLSFSNSSLTGDIKQPQDKNSYVNPEVAPHKPTTTATFSGNHSTDGYAWKGNLINNEATTTITLDNGAIWEGDATLSSTNTKDVTTKVVAPKAVGNITLNKGSKQTGTITTTGNAELNLQADNSSINTITATGSNASVTASNKSTIATINHNAGKGDYTLDSGSTLASFTANAGGSTLSLSDSSVANNINIATTSGTTTINASSGSSIGQDKTKDMITIGNGATLNAILDNSSLHIKGISGATANANSTITFNNLSGSDIGNVDFAGILTGVIHSSSMGTLKNTNARSIITILDTQGQSYGDINYSAGSLYADFDFSPQVVDKTDPSKNINGKIGNITLGATANAYLIFNFGGEDSTTKQAVGKQSTTDSSGATTPVKISGGSNNDSSYEFNNIGTLSLTDTADGKPVNLPTLIANQTGILMDNLKGVLIFQKTNIVLNAEGQSGKPNVNSALSLGYSPTTPNVGIDTGNSSFRLLDATFGNAIINDPDKGVIPNSSGAFYTLSQSGESEDSQGFVKGKTSNGNIGYIDDNIQKYVSFIFTKGTFSDEESGYTGTISGGTHDSEYLFYNAGFITTAQITNYLGELKLEGTRLTGVLGQSTTTDGTTTPKDVNITLDYSGDSSNPYGLGIVGIGKHNITFNFTGNTSDVKFAGTLLGGTTTAIAGSKNTDNQITIYGLDGIKQAQEGKSSLMDILHNAGVSGFNQTTGIADSSGVEQSFVDSTSKTHIPDYSTVSDVDKMEIAKGTTFKFLNTNFNSTITEKDYALDMTFASDAFANVANEKNIHHPADSLIQNSENIALVASSFGGNRIDLSDNVYDNSFSFLGNGSISNDDSSLQIALGTGKNNITVLDTGATLVLTGSSGVADGSTLKLANTSLIGDWTKGGDFVFGKNSALNPDGTPGTSVDDMVQSSFYGKLSNDATSALSVNLGQNSIKSADDSAVTSQYDGALKSAEGTFDIPTISFANTDSSKNKLTLDNPGGKLKLEGLSNTVNLSSDSSLVSNNTTIIGDIYGATFAHLAFDTTTSAPTYYQGGATDTITGLKDGSSISFTGKGAFRTSKYSDTDKSDSGTLHLNLGVNLESIDITALNTGGTIELLYQNQAENTSGSNKFFRGNVSLKGVSVSTNAMGLTQGGGEMNMTFAKASATNEKNLLTTQDGSLLTSSTDNAGKAKDINDYVQSSALTIAGKMNLTNATLNFIGDESFSTTTKESIALGEGGKATLNFINTGDMLKADTSKISSTFNTNSKILFQSLLVPSTTSNKKGDLNYSYNLIGSSLGGDFTISAPSDGAGTAANVSFTATFDNEDFDNRSDDSRKYYSDPSIGNSQLQIAKSTLSGTLTLGDNATEQGRITANLTFYGKDALSTNAKIKGGNKQSTFTFNDTNLDFGTGSTTSTFDVAGNVILNNVSGTGILSSIGSGILKTKGVQTATGESNSTDNVLAFVDTDVSKDLSNINGFDYSLVKKGGSFKGTLATTKNMTYTFVGANSQGFNVAPTIDEATKVTSNADNLTKLDKTLSNATINVVDGGALQTQNLEGTTAGNKNTLNLYGTTSLAMTTPTEGKAPNLAINSAGLTINATIDTTNYAQWGGTKDANGNISTDFDISNPTTGTSAIYNFTFNGNYSYPDYDHQFYKGTISGLTADSTFTFNNAGYLLDTQTINTNAHIVLNNTVVRGNLSDNKITLDFRPNEQKTDGLMALTGNIVKKYATPAQVKDIIFDFTGNTIADKIINPDEKSDGNYYIAGDNGSKFTFINLQNNTTGGDVPETDTSIVWEDGSDASDGVFNTLQKSGVHLKAGTTTDTYVGVSQSLDKDTTFNFYGSSIFATNADKSISSSYSLGFIFDGTNDGAGITSGKLNSTLKQSIFTGSTISSAQNLDVSLYGANAFRNDNHILNLQAGNGKILNIYAQSTEGTMGIINVKNTTAVGAGSSLDIDGAGFGGTYLTSIDTTTAKKPKGGNIKAKFTSDSKLADSSILGTKDGTLNVGIDYNYQMKAMGDGSDMSDMETIESTSAAPKDVSKAPTFIIGTGKTTLDLENAGVIKINSSNKALSTWNNKSAGTYFANGSSIKSNATAIVGDIYGFITTPVTGKNKTDGKGTLNANLSFDTADGSFYQGGSTDTISGLRGNSKLSFSGKGALRSSKYDMATGKDSGTINLLVGSAYNGDDKLNLSVINTGGTLNLGQNTINSQGGMQGNYNLKGVNLTTTSKDGLHFYNAEVSMTFASADDKTQASLLSTQDGSLLTSSKSAGDTDNIKDVSEYVESSTFNNTNGLILEVDTDVSYKGYSFNFIGDKSLSTTAKTIFQAKASRNSTARIDMNINLINTGDMLKTDTSKLTANGVTTDFNTHIDTLGSIVFASNSSGNAYARYNYTLKGSNLANATVSASGKNENVKLNAIFDTRDLDHRVDQDGNAIDNLQYYSDDAIGGSKLQIAKSSLSGTLTLGNNATEQGRVTANLAFYGKDALASAGKIVGGSAGSSILVDGSGSYTTAGDTTTPENATFNFASVKGFKGSVNVINTSLASDLEDKAGVTIDASGNPVGLTNADKSVMKSFQITFNASEDQLKTQKQDEQNTNGATGETPDVIYSESLTSAANDFIKNSIIGTNTDGNGNGLKIDLKNTHGIDKAIGYTSSALNVNFIGNGSILTTGYKKDDTDKSKYVKNMVDGKQQGFYIHDDNANNVYNFIDFGRLDANLFSEGGNINGTIKWIGNTYEVGTIYGARDLNIDFNNLPDAEVAKNIYIAEKGIQNIVFDFGGDTKKADGTYKMGGYVGNGAKTIDSTYTYRKLGDVDISKVAIAGSDVTGTKDFLDVLNTIINPDMKAIQAQSGTTAVDETSIVGNIDWSKAKASNGVLKLSFSDEAKLNGSLEGDGTKDVSFDGAMSLNKDAQTPSEVGVSPAPTTITGGDDKSQYAFNNIGSIDQKTFNDLVNSGNDGTDGKASNAGTFSFDGNSVIDADIKDAKDVTNASSQNILLGKNSDEGIRVISTISTSAKVDAKFGVGSQVTINNKNENSQYDFSALAGNAPVIASINMDSDGSDGIKKAKVLGFDKGDVSLIGSINDSNEGATDVDAITNVYQFGDADKNTRASWLLTNSSKVANLGVYNQSVIDLRGTRMVQNTSNSSSVAGAIISGASIDGASAANNANFAPTTLTIQKADLDNAIIRLGVDTANQLSDRIIIQSLGGDEAIASRSNNALQVFLSNGTYSVSQPILLAQISDESQTINKNFFSTAGYTQGLYNIKPIVEVRTPAPVAPVVASKPDTDPTAPAKPADVPSTPADTAPIASVAPAPSDTADKTPAVVTSAVEVSSAPASGSTSVVSAANQCVGGDNTLCYYLDGFNASVNESSTNTLKGTLGTFYRDFRIATNNLNLRMGELRDNGASQGVWARIINGLGSDKSNNKDFYTTLQAGYDYKFDVLGGVNYLGVDAEASIVSSSGDAYSATGRNLGVGIYNTYIMDNGFYVDASAKYLNLGNRISIKDSAILSDTTSNLTSNAFLLGAEVGYRYSLDAMMKAMRAPVNAYTQGYYIEPQAEIIYGYIGGTSYDLMQSGAKITADLAGNNALISRVGAVLGKHFKYTNGVLMDVRVGLSYINELNSGGDTTFTEAGSNLDPIHSTTDMNNKLNLSLGTNVKFNDDWRLYADVSRTFLGVYNFDYNLNVGARFSFGNKMSDLAKQKSEEKKAEKADRNAKEAQEKAKLIEEKKIINLNTKGAKVGCEGCLPEKGLYLQVAVLGKKDPNITKDIAKTSYRTYEFDITGKDGKSHKAVSYLIGPFKDIQQVYKNKAFADKLMQKIYKDNNAHSTMYEVK